MRGLYGGSLWLEPSFHGLQWPQNARTGVGISGTFWTDTGYEMIKRDFPSLPNSGMYFQQGRGQLRVTPAYVHGRFFIQGQVELVGNLCQTANVTNVVCNAGTFTTDDLWIRVGEWNRWDLKLGRFEAWEVYHLGMGMDPYTFERLIQIFDRGDPLPADPLLALCSEASLGDQTGDRQVCNCRKVTESRLRVAIADGANTVESLCEATGAGTGCGSCKGELAEFVARHAVRTAAPE